MPSNGSRESEPFSGLFPLQGKQTALHLAAYYGHRTVCFLLLARGALIDSRDKVRRERIIIGKKPPSFSRSSHIYSPNSSAWLYTTAPRELAIDCQDVA